MPRGFLLMSEFDVVVVGGGCAGLAAAVNAARTGARTLLVERGSSLGGTASAALVHSICGLFLLPEFTGSPGATLANEGFAAELSRRLVESAGEGTPESAASRMGRVDVLLQHPTDIARVADRFVAETPLLSVRFHSEVIGVDAGFRTVEIFSRGRRETVAARTVVDASGDALAVSLGGAAWEQAASERLQRPAFIFALQDVSQGVLQEEGRLRIVRRIASAVQAGTLPEQALGGVFRASGRGGGAFVTIDLDAPGYDPLDAQCLTGLETHGRQLASALVAFLRREIPGFENTSISAFPSRVGIRESRRMVGRYRLETADVEAGAEFADAVAVAAWPMELRETNRGPRLRYPTDGRPCQVPLRSLQARDHANLFAAGRCIACSHEAQASIRVIGTCLATGEAAGIAAALMAREGRVDAAQVCEQRALLAGRFGGRIREDAGFGTVAVLSGAADARL
jgi:hypothetical protein